VKKIEDKYKVLSHIDHILLRPQTYLGSNKPHSAKKYLFEDGKMVQREITYVPSFIKIFDEIMETLVINEVNPSSTFLRFIIPVIILPIRFDNQNPITKMSRATRMFNPTSAK
jgi:DNA topoisomerase-2